MNGPAGQLPQVDGFWGDRLWSRLLFSPSREAISCAKRRLEVTASNASVELWLEQSGPRDPQLKLVVLRLLGARGRAEHATLDPARFLPSTACVVATINSPGFGATRGSCTLPLYFAGLGAAYDAVLAEYPGAAIWVHGKSIGGLGALYLAATRSPGAIIVRNVVDVSGIAAARVGRFARTLIPKALDAQRWAALADCPALFVVSVGDRLAEPAIQQEVIEAYGGRATVLTVGGSHDDRELALSEVPRYAEAVGRLWAP